MTADLNSIAHLRQHIKNLELELQSTRENLRITTEKLDNPLMRAMVTKSSFITSSMFDRISNRGSPCA